MTGKRRHFSHFYLNRSLKRAIVNLKCYSLNRDTLNNVCSP